MASYQRQYKLAIWGLALGYFIFYAPYVAFIKIVTTGLWPGINGPVSGFRLLPAVAISTAAALVLIVTLKGWWKYAGRRRIFGLEIPCPRALILLSGFGTAIIIGTTTLIFTFQGVSIILALVLMRGGVLILGPVVDRLFKRRVRWFSWAAFAVTVPAVMIALSNVDNHRLSFLMATIIIAYLSGYILRIPCATKLAKSREMTTTYRYFVEEQMVAVLFLVTLPAILALIGKGEIMMELRHGFTGLFTSSITIPGLMIGGLYAGLYCFGTLIYLDCRENTYCIPLNRGSSLLAGFFVSLALTLFFGQAAPGAAQFASAGLLVTALLLLSPFHHALEQAIERLRLSVSRLRGTLETTAGWEDEMDKSSGIGVIRTGNAPTTKTDQSYVAPAATPRRIFLFVCSGNTCRSPMAAAITNAEIAARHDIPFENLQTVNVRALSAGVSARDGAPLTPEAEQALRSLNVPVKPHAARNLTVDLAQEAEMIFCMTSAHRKAVIELIPSVAWKTFCLDPEGDIEDPIGKGLAAYLSCAQRIRRLVAVRFAEIGLVSEM